MSTKKKSLLEQEKDPLLDKPIEKLGPDKSGENIRQTGQENKESTNVVPDNKEKVLNNKKPQPEQTEQDKDKTHQKGVSTDKLQGIKDVEKFDKEMTKEIRNVKEKSSKFQKSFDTIFAFMGIDDPKIKTAPFNSKAVDDSKEIITDMKQSEYNKKSIKEQYGMCDIDYDKLDEQEINVNEPDDFEYDPLLDEHYDDNFDSNNIGESEVDQLQKVRQDGMYIRNINNPSEQVQLQQVNQNGMQIQYINNPSEQVQMQQVKQDRRQLDQLKNNGIIPSRQVEIQQGESPYDYEDNSSSNLREQKDGTLEDTGETVYIVFNYDLLDDTPPSRDVSPVYVAGVFKSEEEAIKFRDQKLIGNPDKYFISAHKISKFNDNSDYIFDQPINEQIGYKVFLSVVDQINNKKITKESAQSKFKIQQEVNKHTNTEQSNIFTRIYKGINLLNKKKIIIESSKSNIRSIDWLELDTLPHQVADLLFTTFKTHRSRKSTHNPDLSQEMNNNTAWSLLDQTNGQIFIKYIFDDGRKDIFSVPLKEIHKWIKMRSNTPNNKITERIGYNVFKDQPSPQYRYQSYKVFRVGFDTKDQ